MWIMKNLTMVEPEEVQLLVPPLTQAHGTRMQGGAIGLPNPGNERYSSHKPCEKACLPTTVLPLCRECSSFSILSENQSIVRLLPKAPSLGPVSEVHSCKKILTDMAQRLQLNQLQTQNTQLTLLYPEKKSVL